jgi:hypothetical protein
MKSSAALFLTLGLLALSGCVETDDPIPMTGGDLTGATATVCRAAIARQTNNSVMDVAVFDVAESEAGNTVQATVAGGVDPWICRTDRNNRVQQVIYSGSEGTL